MIKYEIWTDSFEIRIGRAENARSLTEREVFDEYLEESANAPRLEKSFSSPEEAEAYFKAHFAKYGTSRSMRGTAGWLLIGQVAYLQADEYDEDGEYIQGGDILMTSSEAYRAKTYYLPADGINPDTIYGGGPMVCISAEEIARLSHEWGVDLMEQMQEATQEDIELFGVYED